MSRVERTLAEKEFNMHQFILRACAINLTIMHQFKPEKELRTNTCANEHHVHGYSKKFFVSKIVTSPGGTQHRRPINLESRCNLDNGEIHHLHHEWRIRLPAPTSSASQSYPCQLPPSLLPEHELVICSSQHRFSYSMLDNVEECMDNRIELG